MDERPEWELVAETLQRVAVAVGAVAGIWLVILWAIVTLARWLF